MITLKHPMKGEKLKGTFKVELLEQIGDDKRLMVETVLEMLVQLKRLATENGEEFDIAKVSLSKIDE